MLNCLAYCLAQTKMNERVPDMTPNKILLDVRVSPTKQKMQQKHLILISWQNIPRFVVKIYISRS